MDVKLIAKMIEINVMVPTVVVVVPLNVPAEGAGALARERRRTIVETIATTTITTTGVHHVMGLVIRDRLPEMETIGRHRDRLPIPTNIGRQLVVGGAAAPVVVEEEEMNIVLHDPLEPIAVTVIETTEDQRPPEMATIVHLEAMIPGEKMDYLVEVVVVEELFIALLLLVELDPAMKGRAVVTITMEIDVQQLLLHPARMMRHELEDWKSPKRPFLRIATSLLTCWPRMKVPTNQTAEMNSKREEKMRK